MLLLLGNQLFAQSANELQSVSPLSIGEQIELHSQILGEYRKINVYLPEGYSKDSLKMYPTIYLLDGSMNEDFLHVSGIVQFGSFSWINMIPKSIVIGIANVDRKRDFTFPTNNKKDKKAFPSAGQSASFIDFIEKELKPFISTRYKTDSTSTIIGQSLGGLLASEILFKRPDLFDNYIIVSPSLWWDDESLLGTTPAYPISQKSVFIAVGKEGEVMERTAKELYDKLRLRKHENTTMYFQFLEEQNHGDSLHLAVYYAFEAIFNTN